MPLTLPSASETAQLKPGSVAARALRAARPSVWLVESHGDAQVVHLEVGEIADLVVVVSPDHLVRTGDVVGVVPDPATFHLFDAVSGKTLQRPN